MICLTQSSQSPQRIWGAAPDPKKNFANFADFA